MSQQTREAIHWPAGSDAEYSVEVSFLPRELALVHVEGLGLKARGLPPEDVVVAALRIVPALEPPALCVIVEDILGRFRAQCLGREVCFTM